MNLIRLKESYRQFCPELQARYEQEYKKAFLVELNIAYVALTRAIEELYIFVPPRWVIPSILPSSLYRKIFYASGYSGTASCGP